MGLLDGKTGLILNIANDRSIAAHIATYCVREGATCGFGYLPFGDSNKSERRVRRAMEEGGYGDAWLHACDVGSDESIETFFAAVARKFGKIDFLVHSLAYANKDYLKKEDGVFTATPRDVYAQAVDISAYSLLALTREASKLMPDGGSVICLSYVGGEKVVPGYNVMGVAKAALESTARYLAFDLGGKNIRVNTISAGPVKTLSAMAVGGIDDMFTHVARKSSLRRNIEGEEVGKAALYLLSDLASGVSGTTLYVDCGFFSVGI